MCVDTATKIPLSAYFAYNFAGTVSDCSVLGIGQLRASASNFIPNETTSNSIGSQTHVLPSDGSSNVALTSDRPPALQATPLTTAPLTYHGEPVQAVQYVYAIFWLPAGYHYEPAGNDSQFELLISRYFKDVSESNFYQMLVQYPDNINASPSTSVVFTGGFVDTSPYPQFGNTTDPLLGSDITSEVGRVISSGSLPTGVEYTYYVFTASGINVCADYAIGRRLFTLQYVNGTVTINADPYTALTIGPMSYDSDPGSEKWCLDALCQGDVISPGNSARAVKA